MKGSLRVVKIGGNIVNDKAKLEEFLEDFAAVEESKILVHGGGRIASDLARSLGIETRMVGGRRITDADTLDIVTMVYAGLVNKRIVSKLQSFECDAIGLSGADGNSILAHKRVAKDIDYGYAGDVDRVNSGRITSLLNSGLVPVFCAITHDKKGQLLNTNADTIASELAKGLSHYFDVELVYCFEKRGVLEDVEDEHSVIEHIDREKYEKMKQAGRIAHGMLPKLENCFGALKEGVKRVVIGGPAILREPHQKHTTISL